MSLDGLVRALAEPCGDPAIRARLASELTIRGWLYAGGGDWERVVARETVESGWHKYGLPKKIQALLSAWLKGQQSLRSYQAPDLGGVSMVFHNFLRRDLADFENAHGVIPFVMKGEHTAVDPVVILPFMLEASNSSDIRTAEGISLTGLKDGVERARRGLVSLGALQVHESFVVILTSLNDPGTKLEGRSLGLPVMAAHYFRRKKVLPKALAVGLSGCLDHNGHLDVDTLHVGSSRAKADRMASFGIPMRIFPAGDDVVSVTKMWPLSQSLDECLSNLCQEVRTLPLTLMQPTQDSGVRLDGIGKGMRFGSMSAQHALVELDQIAGMLEGRTDCMAEHHLVTLKGLKASALCHLGRAKESHILAGEILSMRDAIGAIYIAEAMVRQAVNMTDFADYQQAVTFADDAFRLARSLSLVERRDMELKALSTKAQALTSWALIEPARAMEARDLSLKAVDIAREIDSISPEREKNVPRNLVYAFLWHALHDSGGAMVYGAAIRDEVTADPKSWSFYLKARWLGAYRALLTGVMIDWRLFEDEMPDDHAEGGWLFALASKYRGALRAATGDIQGALSDFEEATKLVDIPEQSPLLAFLSATAGVEAVALLGKSAHSMAEKCLPALRGLSGWYLEPRISSRAWELRLTGLLEGRDPNDLPNPQLYFPY